jgi:hypothetical protein
MLEREKNGKRKVSVSIDDEGSECRLSMSGEFRLRIFGSQFLDLKFQGTTRDAPLSDIDIHNLTQCNSIQYPPKHHKISPQSQSQIQSPHFPPSVHKLQLQILFIDLHLTLIRTPLK